ncbi:aspartate-semialdehyde dehydrogenase [Ramicandelaber brevisporus]|nr:aspartate-semialdehyde dehydrogenase [Ramicandelaber brevisporus]
MAVSIPPSRKLRAGVLGATGTVGQRFIVLLSENPWFELHAIGASPRSAGKPYHQAVRWKMSKLMPASVRNMTVQPCQPEFFAECDIVFSGLDADVAGDIELAFREADIAIMSNAKNHRMDPQVPLVVPLVNADHLELAHAQRAALGPNKKRGFIGAISNCSTAGLVVPLKALVDAFGPIDKVMVHTMQAISGAGYPGVPSLDILDNVVPYIGGEEEKLEIEVQKILGNIGQSTAGDARVVSLPIPESDMVVSAHCNRVAVVDGHTMCVSVRFVSENKPTVKQIQDALSKYTCEAQTLGCPSAPQQAIHVFTNEPEQRDRPQPRLDREQDGGFSVSVGRVRPCKIFDVKFVLLAHNTVLGAAGGALLNAELAYAKGILKL